MNTHKGIMLPALLAAFTLSAGLVGADGGGNGRHTTNAGAKRMGFEIAGTKDELKLNYDVAIQDNGGGRMYVTFTLADDGRLKPITAVDLEVPSKDGSGYYDLVIHLAPYEKDGKKIYSFQLTRDLVERGEIDLKTNTLDGKRLVDWGYHRVGFAPFVKEMDKKAAEKKDETKNEGVPPGPGRKP